MLHKDYSKKTIAIFELIFISFIGVFAYLFTFQAGERGFFPFDQSIVFDGAYRIVSGQVPYKDFVIPVGPMAFLLQAAFFKLFGVSYYSYILGAAVVNVIAAILAVFIIRLLFPAQRLSSYAAGLLTAVWFYPPFGTPYIEQTGFFFILIALFLVLLALRTAGNRLLTAGCGIFVFLSVISKQNVGIFMFPLYPLLLIAAYAPDFKKSTYACLNFLAGFAISLLLFSLWLFLKSDIHNFYLYTANIPSVYGIGRLVRGRSGFTLIKELVINGTWLKSKTALAAIGINAILGSIVYLAYRKFSLVKDALKSCLLPGVIFIYLINYQHLFIRTSNNSNFNGLAFIGVIFSLGIGLLFTLFNFVLAKIKPAPVIQKTLKVGGIIVTCLLTIFLTSYGRDISLGRYVHAKFSRLNYPHYFTVNKLESLRWGQPMKIKKNEVRAADIVSLLEYLKSKRTNFFIFPDFTIFYGLTGVPSPQPVLWFHKGLTYPEKYDQKLDNWVVDDLRKNKVGIIVIEEASYLDTGPRLRDFKLLKAYLKENFKQVKQIGIFSIYTSQAGQGPD